MNKREKLKHLYELLDRSIAVIAPSEAGPRSFETDVAAFRTRFDPEASVDARTSANRASNARSSEFHASALAVPESDASDFASLYADWSRSRREARLAEIADAIRACERCPLSLGRTNAVPGEGVLDPLVIVVGEGPGAQEDADGRPFVGKAGQYLDKWLAAIGLARGENVFIANVVKCRPPGNRDPKPDESDACLPYLEEQIALIRPRLILTVGRISMRLLTGTQHGITRIHGTFYHYCGIPLVPTFHPSGVLRTPAWRRPVWEDLKSVRNWLIDNAGHTAP